MATDKTSTPGPGYLAQERQRIAAQFIKQANEAEAQYWAAVDAEDWGNAAIHAAAAAARYAELTAFARDHHNRLDAERSEAREAAAEHDARHPLHAYLPKGPNGHFDLTGWIIDYEGGELDQEATIAGFQRMIDDGIVWTLQGHYGRTARDLIAQGLCSADEGKVVRQ